MQLSEKLNSLASGETVSGLNEMLRSPYQLSVSWFGQRLVSFNGYEGSVEINTLALKYLKAKPFVRSENPTLQERLECYALWDKVQKLYTESLNNISTLYANIVWAREFRPYCRACAGDPQAIMGEWEFGAHKDSLFEFSVEEYKSLWPNSEPQGKSWCGADDEKWSATKEMVEAAVSTIRV